MAQRHVPLDIPPPPAPPLEVVQADVQPQVEAPVAEAAPVLQQPAEQVSLLYRVYLLYVLLVLLKTTLTLSHVFIIQH